nr:MAG TPA: regulatory protein [Caudoviricetes sp.]
MNDIVFCSDNGQLMTTSLKVAEVFGKEHSKVVRDIENISCSDSFRVANFGDTPYVNPQNGQTYKMYSMTKDGFVFLVMGYRGAKAAQFKEAYIEAFNKMEKAIKEAPAFPSPIDVIGLKQLVETTQVMAAQISQMQVELNKQHTLLSEPKQIIPVQPLSVGFNTKEKRISPRQIPYFTVKKMATELGVTSKQLNAVLELEDIQRWNFPKQRWELNPVYRGYDLTYTVVYEPVDPDDEPREYMVWSSNGRKFIYDVLSERRRLQQQY